MSYRLALAVAVAACTSAVPTIAHHSFAAEFSYELTGTIEGEVIEALYVNPHARYFVSVVDADGNEQIWDAQTRSPSALARAGWSADLINVGDRVVIEGNLGNNDTRKIWIRRATLPDDRVVRPYSGQDD